MIQSVLPGILKGGSRPGFFIKEGKCHAIGIGGLQKIQ
jgi:hypothetical protein